MYNFGKRDKERARQQKQIDQASKRIMAKQQKASIKTQTMNAGSDKTEQEVVEEIVKCMPQSEETENQ
jgi:DNA-binding helix-hairpin-helix protein with protein kinase domain